MQSSMQRMRQHAAPKSSSAEFRSDQPSLRDQQFEERLRIAEHLVRLLREAGYSCELGEDGLARALKRED
jgi:hypothetical protein